MYKQTIEKSLTLRINHVVGARWFALSILYTHTVLNSIAPYLYTDKVYTTESTSITGAKSSYQSRGGGGGGGHD